MYMQEHEMEMEIEAQRKLDTQLGVEMESNTGDGTSTLEPLYIAKWNKLKRHVNGKLDDEAEFKLHKFQELHENEIQEKGADKLSIQEAFTDVLGYHPGYAR
ncbi:hypothetical protein RND71_011968 [Anisodus tanguticus]|uniref:Uncharacterized protein n=1 Tax=Anisodus tanguticus TaxID=243964 RepID=A0AAE1SED7_9SOLA|nr:hypothetical protein RND71_011968 [Anisodus tanguticus]